MRLARMTPGRLAFLIAALFSLSALTALGIARYPDQQFVSVDEANELNRAYFEGEGASYVSEGGCLQDAPDQMRPCIAIRLHNFAARARAIAAGIVLAMFFSAMAFRRSLDTPREVSVGYG
jgi:hypothetical protein